MPEIRIGLIAESKLLREGIKSLLGSTFLICAEAETTKGIDRWRDAPDLILVDIHDTEDDAAVAPIKARFPTAYVVFLLDRPSRQAVVHLLQTGADGALGSDLSTEALVQSLRLVLTGQVVVPSLVIDLLAEAQLPPRPVPAELHGSISAREQQILDLIVMGASNKAIALALNIREPTVKFYVKTLMRKIGAANRTQIAVWAMNLGYGADDAGATQRRMPDAPADAPARRADSRAMDGQALSYASGPAEPELQRPGEPLCAS
ncbi:LuxR C-terminal-related transcriptional regulator [Azospirillum sp. ST 5-10]|uniref:LuxR C-terminal-related transcriptional regulator n=1 Tax=unclassified Azospirillum TaxID=2630922 RepID=UPI003F49C4CE